MTMVSIDNNNQDNNVIISVKNPVQRAFCAFPRQSLDRTTTTTTVLRPFFRDHPGEPVPEENFWTLWCKGRVTEADTSTIQLGITPSGLTSAHLHHPPYFFTGRMPFLPPNQHCQSAEGNTPYVTISTTNPIACIRTL